VTEAERVLYLRWALTFLARYAARFPEQSAARVLHVLASVALEDDDARAADPPPRP
jgi:hypothetical protein